MSFLSVFLITVLFAFLYLRRYKHQYESDLLSFLASVFCLVVVLITSSLLPVDIFLVSYMKTPAGSWAEWATVNITRQQIENQVQIAYYILYSVVFLCIFVIIPFIYFYFEEKNDDDAFSTVGSRLCTAFKFTLAFVFFVVVLLLIGVFVPLRQGPDQSANATEWEKIKFLWDELQRNKGEDAIEMVLSLLSLIGMINLVVYTSFGMFSWPMGMIRGNKSASIQSEEIQEQSLLNQTQITMLRTKERETGRLSQRDRAKLEKLERNARIIANQEHLVDEVRSSIWYKCRRVLRPLEIVIGIVLCLLAFLIWISLLLTNIDKALHSEGPKAGYSLKIRTIPNPIDIVLVYLQQVFPLDYLLFLIMAWFFVLCTISGIRNLGIRLFFVKMYKLRLRRTRPQALLMTCATLMLTVLAVNILLFCVSPSYVKYGSQKYKHSINGTEGKSEIIPCDSTDEAADDCQMTRNSALLERFFYKAWFFGAAYYWSSWAFLGFSFLSLVYVILRKSRNVTDEIVDDDDDDLEQLDDDPASSRPSRNSRLV